jgi:hypothetical protein
MGYLGWHRKAQTDTASPPVPIAYDRVTSDAGPRRVLKKKTPQNLSLSSNMTAVSVTEAGSSVRKPH